MSTTINITETQEMALRKARTAYIEAAYHYYAQAGLVTPHESREMAEETAQAFAAKLAKSAIQAPWAMLDDTQNLGPIG